MSFAKLVRESVAHHFPAYAHVETSPGPGTQVLFRQVRATASGPWLLDLELQRDKYGGWFRVNFGYRAIDDGACSHGFRVADEPSIGTVDLTQHAVDVWLGLNAGSLRKRLKKIERRLDAAAKRHGAAATACRSLPTLYATWYRKTGRHLAADAFAQGPAPAFQIVARDSFRPAVRASVRATACIDSFWVGRRARRPDELDRRALILTCAVCDKQHPRRAIKIEPARDAALARLGLVEHVCRACR